MFEADSMKVSNTRNVECAQLWMTEAFSLAKASDRMEILNTSFLQPLTKVMEFWNDVVLLLKNRNPQHSIPNISGIGIQINSWELDAGTPQ